MKGPDPKQLIGLYSETTEKERSFKSDEILHLQSSANSLTELRFLASESAKLSL